VFSLLFDFSVHGIFRVVLPVQTDSVELINGPGWAPELKNCFIGYKFTMIDVTFGPLRLPVFVKSSVPLCHVSVVSHLASGTFDARNLSARTRNRVTQRSVSFSDSWSTERRKDRLMVPPVCCWGGTRSTWVPLLECSQTIVALSTKPANVSVQR